MLATTLPGSFRTQRPQAAPQKLATVGIIIPVHNRKFLLQNLLEQIYEQIDRYEGDLDNLFVIVVDDGSTDGTSEFIRVNFPQVCLVRGNGSLWWTGAIVKGMEYAIARLDADYFVWLNDDLSLDPNFISQLIQINNSSEYKETIVGGIVTDKAHPEWVVYSGLKKGKPIRHLSYFSAKSELETETISGNIVIIPRTIVDRVGFPNAQKFPHYGGDYEFIREVKQKGFKTILSSQLKASTDYQVGDLIRYMPYWMQWYLQPSLFQRWKIFRGLCSIKANQNIWLFVNLKNQSSARIPQWKYFLCYCAKAIKLLLIDFFPKRAIAKKIDQYFADWNVPPDIAALALQQRNDIHHSSLITPR